MFGDWNGVFRRFSRRSAKGVWWRIFEVLSDDPDFEHRIVDSTIVRAHDGPVQIIDGGVIGEGRRIGWSPSAFDRVIPKLRSGLTVPLKP